MTAMINCLRAITVATFLASTISVAGAQDLHFQKGFSEAINIPGAVAEVTIGDNEIVDLLPLTQNDYVVNALEVGTTNLTAYDVAANVLFHGRISVRPADMWPGFELHVSHGTKVARTFVCDPDGCPTVATTNYVREPGTNATTYDTTTTDKDGDTVTRETTVTRDAPAPAQPAPQ